MELLEIAQKLITEVDSEKTIESFEKGKRKTVYYRVSGGKDSFKEVEALINDILWDIEFVFGDDLRKGHFKKLAEIVEIAETAIDNWETKKCKDGIAQQVTVVAKGYAFAGENGLEQIWHKFTRNVKLTNENEGTAKVLNREVNVKFDEEKGVWFEIV